MKEPSRIPKQKSRIFIERAGPLTCLVRSLRRKSGQIGPKDDDLTIRMSEIHFRPDQIADALLENLGLGESAIDRPVPDGLAVAGDDEGSACSRDQGQGADFFGKRRQDFLCHPGGAEQPAALAAVGNGDMRGRQVLHRVRPDEAVR